MTDRELSANAGPDEVAAFFNVSRESLDLLLGYHAIVRRWQARINLFGPKEMDRFWTRHIADGLQLCSLFDRQGLQILDLGSGGGIPGLVLAICAKSHAGHVGLIESNKKKAAFLREVVRELDLPATVYCQRIERTDVPRADFITARALAPLSQLLAYSEKLVKNGGELLFLKGLDVVDELTETTKYWNIDYESQVSRVDSRGRILHIRGFYCVDNFKQGKE